MVVLKNYLKALCGGRDSRNYRYCIDNGKRTRCPSLGIEVPPCAVKPGGKKPKEKPEKPPKATIDNLMDAIEALKKDPTKFTPLAMSQLIKKLNDLKVVELKILQKKAGIRAGGIKADRIYKIANEAYKQAEFAKDKEGKPGKKKPKPEQPEERPVEEPEEIKLPDKVDEPEVEPDEEDTVETEPEEDVAQEEEPQEEETDEEPTEEGRSDGAGGEESDGESTETGGSVEGEAEGPGDEEADKERDAGAESVSETVAARVPANLGEVNKRIDRFERFFRGRNQHHVADMMGMLKAHINAVGAEKALESLGKETAEKYSGEVQYSGASQSDPMWKDMGSFAQHYLDRAGIITLPQEGGYFPSKETPLVATSTEVENFVDRTEDWEGADFLPIDPIYVNKLEEAKHIPGLESSEDLNEIMSEDTTHITDDVVAKLDEKYGEGKWIIKTYDDQAAAGFGVYFAQRAAEIKRNAQNLIWSAGEQIGKYGFELKRNESGRIVGIRHEGGDNYDFGSERYEATIGGEVREWCDRLTKADPIMVALVSGGEHGEKKQDVNGSAIDNEQGASLPQGGYGGGVETRYMVQPAFKVVGVSDTDRASGRTIAPGEGRVHVTTQNGKVKPIPHATWIKGEPLPVVFETEDTVAMAEAVRLAIESMPEEHRQGQVYSPDVIKTESGYKVVELNPMSPGGGSGYVRTDPFMIDAYTSYMTGRSPVHVNFIRKLLTDRKVAKYAEAGERPPEVTLHRGKKGGEGGTQTVSVSDARAAAQIDATQPKSGRSPETFGAVLDYESVPNLRADDPEGERWRHPEEVQRAYNEQLLTAAKAFDDYVPPEKFARVTHNSPNVGGMEHDVHEDAENNRFFKFTKGGHFGQNKDAQEYLERHRIANQLWPQLGYQFHGITQDAQGSPQVVMSMNRIEGTHPKQEEIHDWFAQHGWVPTYEEDADWKEKGPGYEVSSWRAPNTGIVIGDTYVGNFIKTSAGLVPIDVDILPGEDEDEENEEKSLRVMMTKSRTREEKTFRPMNRLKRCVRKSEGTCKPGERADLTGCTPASRDVHARTHHVEPFAPKRVALDSSLHQDVKDALMYVTDFLAKSSLSREQKVDYASAIQRVLKNMPPAAAKRVHAFIAKAHFFADKQGLKDGILKANPNAKNIASVNPEMLGGLYGVHGGNGELFLDGGRSGAVAEMARKAGQSVHIHETYAHELTHAIDGPRFVHSGSRAWKAIHEEEFKNGQLTRYAGTEPAESFAEFGRALYAGEHDLKAVKAKFPKAYAYFVNEGFAQRT